MPTSRKYRDSSGKAVYIKKNSTITLKRDFEYGSASIKAAAKYTVSYNGTQEEIKRADVITSVYLSNIIDKATPIVGAVGDVFDGIGYYATDNNAQGWAKKISDAGYSKDEKGAMQYFVDNSKVLQDIKNTKTAKEVIDKYSEKVKDRKPTRVLKIDGSYNK